MVEWQWSTVMVWLHDKVYGEGKAFFFRRFGTMPLNLGGAGGGTLKSLWVDPRFNDFNKDVQFPPSYLPRELFSA